jgi:hypothetical protein
MRGETCQPLGSIIRLKCDLSRKIPEKGVPSLFRPIQKGDDSSSQGIEFLPFGLTFPDDQRPPAELAEFAHGPTISLHISL